MSFLVALGLAAFFVIPCVIGGIMLDFLWNLSHFLCIIAYFAIVIAFIQFLGGF